MKTAELTGASLDWAVAKCEGFTDYDHDTETMLAPRKEYGRVNLDEYSYSTDWAQGGPIIEREGFSRIVTNISGGYTVSKKQVGQDNEGEPTIKWVHGVGETLLIAAMRCYVASKLGDTLEIPEELIKC